MKQESNLNIAAKIFASGISKNIISNLLAFANRTVFLYFLGKELLGINSAVISIINILSLSELGVGTSFLFILYKAINRKDNDEINSIMKYFKKIYTLIGCFIIVIGCLLIPFLDKLIVTPNNVHGFVLPCYLIFVLQTSISYFFSAYKRCLLMADKKENIVNNVLTFYTILNSIFQITAIVIFKNYIIYLIAGLCSIIIQNLIMSAVTQRRYPYLNIQKGKPVSNEVKHNLKEFVSSIMVVKIGQAFYKASDNIIISKYLGVGVLALYDNYYLLLNAVQQILSMLVSSFTAIIGNLAINGDKEDLYSKYKKLEFITVALFLICAVCYINCVNPFIRAWLSKTYALDLFFVLFFATRFWIIGLNQTLMVFKDALGLFKYGRFLSPLTGIVNILLSILLLKYIGVAGVSLASLLCDLFIYFAVHPKAVIKIGMGKSLLSYYKRYLLFWLMYGLSLFLSYFLVSNIIFSNNIVQFFFNGFVSLGISLGVLFLFMGKSEEYQYLVRLVNQKIGGK